MPAKKGRRLVVDASVAAGAGKTMHPTSKRCRDFLLTLRQETGCRVVMPPKLREEWDEHMTPFARTWLAAMTSRRRIISEDVETSGRMRREIEKAAAKPTELAALRKDFHLVEAAIATDKTVVSRDEEVRRLFKAAAPGVVAIQRVVWVNPTAAAERPLEWLLSGAKSENARMLGHRER